MYGLWIFEDLGGSAVQHPEALVRNRDQWREDGIGAAFVQSVLDRYFFDGMNLLQIRSLADQSQFVESLKANNSNDTGPKDVRSGKEGIFDAVVVEEAYVEYWDLDGAMTATKADGNGLRETFRDLQTECR